MFILFNGGFGGFIWNRNIIWENILCYINDKCK